MRTLPLPLVSRALMEEGLYSSDQDILHVSDVFHQMLDFLEDPSLAKHILQEDVSHLEKLFLELKEKSFQPSRSIRSDVSLPFSTAHIYASHSHMKRETKRERQGHPKRKWLNFQNGNG